MAEQMSKAASISSTLENAMKTKYNVFAKERWQEMLPYFSYVIESWPTNPRSQNPGKSTILVNDVLHVSASSFDWFTALSVSFVAGQSDNFTFVFLTLKWNPLYTHPPKRDRNLPIAIFH